MDKLACTIAHYAPSVRSYQVGARASQALYPSKGPEKALSPMSGLAPAWTCRGLGLKQALPSKALYCNAGRGLAPLPLDEKPLSAKFAFSS